MTHNFLDIIDAYNLSDAMVLVYGEDYYNSFKPISGWYNFDNDKFICELNFNDIDYDENDYNDEISHILYNILEECGYENIINDQPLSKLKAISLPFYNSLKKNVTKIKDSTTIYLWEKQQEEQHIQTYSNYKIAGEESVKIAISSLENYMPIQNDEGYNYVMYFKFKKEFINNKFFDLFNLDFNIINTQLKRLKINKYYKLKCSDTFNGFEEVSRDYIIEHIIGHTSYDGEYSFFTQYDKQRYEK
jgi:hypothetical protein